MEALKGLRYSIIVDGGSGSMECAYIRDAIKNCKKIHSELKIRMELKKL